MEFYSKILEIDPNYTKAQMAYGKRCILEKMDKTQEALKCFDKILELYPDFDQAKMAKDEL